MSTSNTQRPNYRIYDRTGGGCTHDIYAETLEDAIEAGREWIEDGDWSSDRDNDGNRVYRTITLDCCVREIVYIPAKPDVILLQWDLWEPEYDSESGQWMVDVSDMHDDDDPDCRAHIAEALTPHTGGEWAYEPVGERCVWTPPADVMLEIDEDATLDGDSHDCSGNYSDPPPDCEAQVPADYDGDVDADGHDWRSPHSLVGGLRENPGVWSNGGTAMSFRSVCRCCGMTKREQDAGSQVNPNEPSSVITMEERDDETTAWLKEEHEDDGWLPAWLAEYLDCLPTVRMTEEQAREYVAEHTDEDGLDEDDLAHAFGAIFGRKPDDKDIAEGLWSHLCA